MFDREKPANPFEAINFYNAPEVLLSQAIEGELSVRSAGSVIAEVFGDAGATPLEERNNSFEAKLRANAGGNPVSDALIGVATNPLTWLMLATEVPVFGDTAKALSFFRLNERFNPFLRKVGTTLSSVWMETGAQMLRGTGANRLVSQVERVTDGFRLEDGRVIEDAINTFSKFTQRATEEQLRTAEIAIAIKLGGLNKKQTQQFVRSVDLDKGTKLYEKTQEALVDMTDGEVDALLAKFGATDLVNQMRVVMDRQPARMFGKDGIQKITSTADIDMDKVYRVFGGLENMSDKFKRAHGLEAFGSLFDKEVFAKAAADPAARAKLDKALKDLVVTEFTRPNYLPRNVGRVLRPTSDFPTPAKGTQGTLEDLARAVDRLEEDAPFSEKLQGRILPFASGVRQRSRAESIFDPRDLQFIQNSADFRTGTEFSKYLTASLKNLGASKGADVYVSRLDGTVAFTRYVGSTHRHAAMFSTRMDDVTDGIIRDSVSEAKAGLEKLHREGKGLHRYVKEVREPTLRDTSIGGRSYADGFDEVLQRLPNNNSAEFLENVVLPRMSGRLSNRGTVAGIVKENARFAASTFANSQLGQLIKNSGRLGKRYMDEIEAMADDTGSLIKRNSRSDISIADYLYVSHLGINMGSVVANLTQPLLTTARWATMGQISHGYKEAMKQMGGIYQDLAKTVQATGKMPSKLEYRNILQRNIRLADTDAGDLVDVTSTARELLDDRITKTWVDGIKKGKTWDQISETMMFPFQQAELLNRIASAEAMAVRVGVGTGRRVGRAAEAVREAVQESQFGSGLMNTPRAFLDPASPLANPLLRQFFQFPARMLTSPLAVDARMAGVPSSIVGRIADASGVIDPNLANNFARGVGISAIGYEVVKGLFGADVSDFGITGNTFQLAGGIIDDRDGPIPVPPVFSIGADMLKMVTFQDQEAFGRLLPRVLPGGIALNRLVGISPEFERMTGGYLPAELNPQKTYVDWGAATEDGLVPIRTADDRLLGVESKWKLFAKGLGLDVRQFQKDSDIERFLLRERDNINELRARGTEALLNNNPAKYKRTLEEFQRRYGANSDGKFIDKQYFRRRLQRRFVPRAEQIAGSMPRDVRERYMQLLSNTRGERLGVTQEELMGAQGAAQRAQLRTDEMLQVLQGLSNESLDLIRQLPNR